MLKVYFMTIFGDIFNIVVVQFKQSTKKDANRLKKGPVNVAFYVKK